MNQHEVNDIFAHHVRHRTQTVARLNAAVDEAMKEIGKHGSTTPAPRDLGKQVRELLRCNPELPWDAALLRIVASDGSGSRPGG